MSCLDLKITGSGQKETPCMSIRGLQRLVMILGGKVVAKYRKKSQWMHYKKMKDMLDKSRLRT